MNQMKIYCDGACSGNPGPGGWAFLRLTPNRGEELVSGWDKDTTNNKMELTAFLEALKLCLTDSHINKSTSIIFYLDSKYVLDGIAQWIHGWKKNGWRTSTGKPVANSELWLQVDKAYMELQEVAQPILEWVKGHAGNPGNEVVDQEACKMRDHAARSAPNAKEGLGQQPKFDARTNQLGQSQVVENTAQRVEYLMAEITRLKEVEKKYNAILSLIDSNR